MEVTELLANTCCCSKVGLASLLTSVSDQVCAAHDSTFRGELPRYSAALPHAYSQKE